MKKGQDVKTKNLHPKCHRYCCCSLSSVCMCSFRCQSLGRSIWRLFFIASWRCLPAHLLDISYFMNNNNQHHLGLAQIPFYTPIYAIFASTFHRSPSSPWNCKFFFGLYVHSCICSMHNKLGIAISPFYPSYKSWWWWSPLMLEVVFAWISFRVMRIRVVGCSWVSEEEERKIGEGVGGGLGGVADGMLSMWLCILGNALYHAFEIISCIISCLAMLSLW